MARKWRGGPRGIWYSDEHEAEAREARLRKPPSRFGTWVLRHLGYKGEIGNRHRTLKPDGPTSAHSIGLQETDLDRLEVPRCRASILEMERAALYLALTDHLEELAW